MKSRTHRLGLCLFAVYLVVYGGFVFLNAFAPSAMEATPVAGVNLAILYGFGLIVVAIALALLYGWLAMEKDAPNGVDARADNSESTTHDRPPNPRARPAGPTQEQT